MQYISREDGMSLNVSITGRLDISIAATLEDVLKSQLDGITDLILNLSDLEYISSAGLRALISAHKVMKNKGGSMTVKGAKGSVRNILVLTGFIDILDID